MTDSFQRLISWHAGTRAFLSDTLYRFSRRYIMAWSNMDHDLGANGERWILQTILSRQTEAPVIFDIGANIGDWSAMVVPHLPQARLIAFEPIPPVRAKLETSLAGTSAEVLSYAMSNEVGSVTINYTPDNSHFSSLESMDGNCEFAVSSVEVERRMGDELCNELGIDRIRFLKVDTEGHDLKVLQGFARMVAEGRIDVIQFEYNYMSVYSRTFLKDFYDMLAPTMAIGRLLPDRVEFADYDFSMDNFIQSNWIAVRTDLVEDRAALSR